VLEASNRAAMVAPFIGAIILFGCAAIDPMRQGK